jgi:2-polyprenyl-3-methyl-5-hydroxy-6-metoxy-1,4-benzoquinol methylase
MNSYYTNTRHDVLDMLPDRPLRNVLEVGGGDFGTILTLRQKHVFETWGLDIRKPNATLDHVITGSITAEEVRACIPKNTFDLVIANDVIEHVEKTEIFVRVVYDALEHGGYLALSVPNIRQIRSFYHIAVRGTFPRTDAGLFDRTHLRWFCKRDIMEIFNTAGFNCVTMKSVGRAVPTVFENTLVGELLGLQNLFLFQKVQ